MDGQRFDTLAKAFALGSSRRALLRVVLGGTAAVAGIRSTPSSAQRTCTDDADCPSLTCCGGVCVNAVSDLKHCGGCFSPCPDTAGSICCDGICRDANTDRNHCGDCDQACDDGLCVDAQCCPASAYCAGACCAGGEACLPPSSPRGRGVCCPPRQVGPGICCQAGEEFISNTRGEPECCPSDRICDVGKESPSFLCCFASEVCVPHVACCPRQLFCNGQCCRSNEVCQDGKCVPRDESTPVSGDEPFCVPRTGSVAAAKRLDSDSAQDDLPLCSSDADCCESGDRCVEGNCRPATDEIQATAPTGEFVDLSSFFPSPSLLDARLGNAGGNMIFSPDGLATVGFNPDLAANLAPSFAGAYHLRYASPPDSAGASEVKIYFTALGYTEATAAQAAVEVFYFSLPPGATDITQGNEGDKGYTGTFPFASEVDQGRSGTAFESGAFLADAARVVIVRTEFLIDPDLNTRLAVCDLVRAALREASPPDGTAPGVAFLPDGRSTVSWQHLLINNQLAALPGESDEQSALRSTEFDGFLAGLGARGELDPDGRYTFGNRVLLSTDPARAATYLDNYPDQFSDLIASQGITGMRVPPIFDFGDNTALYVFTRSVDGGVEPGLTVGGLFEEITSVDGNPASLVVTVSVRDLRAVASDDTTDIASSQQEITALLADLSAIYDPFIRSYPYDRPPRVFTLPFP